MDWNVVKFYWIFNVRESLLKEDSQNLGSKEDKLEISKDMHQREVIISSPLGKED